MTLIVRLIIQTILLVRSGAVWTDEGPNVSRLDPTRSVQVDAEHPAHSRKIVGLNPTKHSKTSAQSDLFGLFCRLPAPLARSRKQEGRCTAGARPAGRRSRLTGACQASPWGEEARRCGGGTWSSFGDEHIGLAV